MEFGPRSIGVRVARTKWGLLPPIIVVLVLVGGLLIIAQGSVLAPFIYAVLLSMQSFE